MIVNMLGDMTHGLGRREEKKGRGGRKGNRERKRKRERERKEGDSEGE